MTKPTWTDAQITAQLDTNYHWSGRSLTFGFPTATAWLGSHVEAKGFSPLNDAEKAAATLAIHLWDELIAPTISFTSDGAHANIKYENSTTGPSYAYTYYPGGSAISGSVWLNPAYDGPHGGATNDLVDPTIGDNGFKTYIHETGHALGLEHPGNYNGGSPTYAHDALYTHDSMQYTVMSYFTADNTGANWTVDGHTYFPQTPMMDDIMAIQKLYGPDLTTRAGDTTYGFNVSGISTADLAIFDFTKNTHPVICIYDAGGKNTLDLSGWNTPCTINLNPGTFSSADGMIDNISIARNTWIDNVVGGGGNDVIHANDKGDVIREIAGDNWLYGGAGNDTLIGGSGSDHMFGGNGNDLFIAGAGMDTFTGGPGADTFRFLLEPGVGARADEITDFDLNNKHDVIDLTALATSSGEHLSFIGAEDFTGAAGQIRFIKGELLGDLNGDKVADFQINLDHVTQFSGSSLVLSLSQSVTTSVVQASPPAVHPTASSPIAISNSFRFSFFVGSAAADVSMAGASQNHEIAPPSIGGATAGYQFALADLPGHAGFVAHPSFGEFQIHSDHGAQSFAGEWLL